MNYVVRHGRRVEVDALETGATKAPRKPFKAEWVKFPLRWVEALQRSKSVSTYQLALAIIVEAFKREHVGGEIVLASTVTGMPKNTRIRAAKEMVELGMIKLYRQKDGQAHRVSILSSNK